MFVILGTEGRARWRATAAVAAATMCWLAGEVHARYVLLVGDMLPATGPSQKAVYRFDDSGTSLGQFANATVGSYFSIAAQGSAVYVAVTGVGVKQFSLGGAFAADLSVPTLEGVPRIETDSQGGIYHVNGGSIGQRLNPDGTAGQTFVPPTEYSAAIDADAQGNVYISSYDFGGANVGLYKFDPLGAYLGATLAPQVTSAADLAIDEVGKILYLADEGNLTLGIKRFDISGPLPVSMTPIATPGRISGLSFDATTGHLLVTNMAIGRGYELQTDGTVLHTFTMPDDGRTPLAFDIAAVLVPEPSAAAICWWALAAMSHRARRGSFRSRPR